MTRQTDRPQLGLGCAPLGNLFNAVTDEDAVLTVDAAWAAGIRSFDTAPLYGFGLSEHRLGIALRSRPRSDFHISTKVGRVLVAEGGDSIGDHPFVDVPDRRPRFDFSRDGIIRSMEESCERLGIDRIDTVFVHDPDDHMEQALRCTFPALIELREAGLVGRIGAGMNEAAPLARLVDGVDLDVVLIAGRYSLLDQTAIEVLLPLCHHHDVAVVVGGVFNSGILANRSSTFNYGVAPASVRERVARLDHIAASFEIELAALALAFPATHPAVELVLFGARSPREVHQNVTLASAHVDPEVWRALIAEGLLDPRCTPVT